MPEDKMLLLRHYKSEGFPSEQAVALANAGVEDAEVAKLVTAKDFLPKVLRAQEAEIEGEQKARLCLSLICYGGRLTTNAQPTSKNILVNDISGVGKDWVTAHVLDFLPSEFYLKRTRISPQLLTYWHNAKFEPSWTWEGKVLYLEDISSTIYNAESFKLLSSAEGEMRSSVLINQTPIDIVVVGKPVLCCTSASATPGRELLRRFPILNLDSSIDQTRAILKRKGREAATGRIVEKDRRITLALAALQPTKISVPYAEQLADAIPCSHPIVRTAFGRLLDLIKFSAAFHQFQRVSDERGLLVTDGQDYAFGKEAFETMLQAGQTIPLTKEQQQILDQLQGHPDGLSAKELSDIMPLTYEWSKRLLDKLAEAGIVGKEPMVRDNSDRKVAVYSYSEPHKITLPSWSKTWLKPREVD